MPTTVAALRTIDAAIVGPFAKEGGRSRSISFADIALYAVIITAAVLAIVLHDPASASAGDALAGLAGL